MGTADLLLNSEAIFTNDWLTQFSAGMIPHDCSNGPNHWLLNYAVDSKIDWLSKA